MIIETKLHIPTTNEQLINRHHLFGRLEKGLNTKLTLVTAPAGYGKSTLLSEWMKKLDVNIAWVSLDENDNDPVRFWKHTMESLHQSSPEFAENLELHLERGEQDVTGTAFVAKLINRLNRLTEKIVLIWDDFHCVDNEFILKNVAYLLEHLPSPVHLYIASRTQPALPLSRMRVEGSLNVLSVEDLRFRKEEVAHFFNKCTDLSFNRDELMAIHSKTEGWIAGMRLVALSTEKKYSRAIIDKMTGEYYATSDYFFEEVFMKQSTEIRELLLKTSILERIHVELVDVLLGTKAGASRMQQLELENLFLVSLDNKRTWYRYHHLFQEFLQRKLKETLPEEWRELYGIAGSWFEENALGDEAIDYYLVGEQYTAAIQLLEKSVSTMIHSNLYELRSWFDKIPDTLLLKEPKLLMYDIFSLLMMGKIETAEKKLSQCLELVREPSTRSGFEMLRVMSALFAHDFELFVRLSEDYVQKYPEADEFISLGTEGDLQIPKWSFLEMVGNLKKRERLIQRLLACWSNSKYYYFTASLYIGYGELMYEWNRLEEAENYLQEANRLGAAHQNKLIIISSNVLLASVYVAEGKTERAKEILHGLNVEINGEQYPQLYDFVQVYQTYFLLLFGEVDQALQWLENCGLQVTDEIPKTMLVEYHLFVTLLAEKGNKEDTISLILRLLREARRTERQGDCILLLIQYSIILMDKGETTGSLDVLEEALSLAEKNHYKRTVIDAGKTLQPLLQFYLVTRQKQHRQVVHTVSLTYVKELLSLNNAFQGSKRNGDRGTAGDIYLTEKEMLVLQYLTTSLTNKEIAHELDVSLSTVKTHINNLYGKLEVSNRREAIERGKLLHLL